MMEEGEQESPLRGKGKRVRWEDEGDSEDASEDEMLDV